MLVIRDEQLARLGAGRSALHAFITDHLRLHFPDQVGDRSDASLAELIEAGERKARRYGIESGAGICKLIDLMVALGEDFDANPAHRWFTRLLDDRSAGSGSDRIDAVAAMAASAR